MGINSGFKGLIMHKEVVAVAMKVVWTTYVIYRRLQNCEMLLLTTSYLSACPHGTTLLPLDGV